MTQSAKRLSLIICLATEVQATFRPDQNGIRLGRTGFGRAYVIRPEHGIVFGSADQIAAEATALAVLKDAPLGEGYGCGGRDD